MLHGPLSVLQFCASSVLEQRRRVRVAPRVPVPQSSHVSTTRQCHPGLFLFPMDNARRCETRTGRMRQRRPSTRLSPVSPPVSLLDKLPRLGLELANQMLQDRKGVGDLSRDCPPSSSSKGPWPQTPQASQIRRPTDT
jgi:hypothetical protein